MIDEKNKKILIRRQDATWFFVFLLMGSFLFGVNVLAGNDYSKATSLTPVATNWNTIVSSYDKPSSGTLSAFEWNGLPYDFVNTWTTSSMAGPLGIGTASPSASLDIFGKLKLTSGGTIYNTDSGRWLDMTGTLTDSLKVSGDLYSTSGRLKMDGTGVSYFTGNLGIGTTTPAAALQVAKNVTYTQSQSGQLYLSGSTNPGRRLMLGYDTTNNYGFIEAIDFGHAYKPIILNPFSGFVGIGTTIPATALDVNGLIKMRNYTISQPEDVINKSYLDSALASSTATIITQVSTSSLWQGSLTGNIYSNNTGNVGIGTNNPVAKLDISGTTGEIARFASAALGTDSNYISLGNTRAQFGFNGVTGNAVVQGGGGKGIELNVNNVFGSGTAILINSAGNVGIGTTNPLKKLDVRGSIFATNDSFTEGEGSIVLGGAAPTLAQTVTRPSGGFAYSLFRGYGYNSTTGLTGKLLEYGAMGNMNSGTTAPTLSYAYFGVGASAQYNNTSMRLYDNASKVVSFDGNVGIGTTNPLFKLDVAGTGNFTQPVIVGTPTANNHAATKSYVDSASASAAESTWTVNGSNIYNSNSGNVGIGTSVPAATLHVNGNAIFGTIAASTQTSTPLNVSFGSTFGNSTPGSVNNLKWDLFTSSSSGSRYGIGMSSGLMEFQSGPGGGLGFFINQGTEAMRINSLGNVGIGTTNPLFKLDVSGTAQFTQPVIVGTPTAAGHAATKSYVDTTAASAAGSTWTVNGSNIYNSNSGNVGIGTTNPGQQLSLGGYGAIELATGNSKSYLTHQYGVNGIDILSLGSNFRRTDYNTGAIATAAFPSTEIRTELAGAYSKIIFATTGTNNAIPTDRMAIDKDGNVGIGSTGPLFKLDVAGTGSFTQPVIVGTPTATNHATTKSYVDSAVSSIGGGIGTGTSGQTLRNNGTSWVANSTLYNNGTNIGIGATSPGAPLQIGNGTPNGTTLYRGLILSGGWSSTAARQQNLITFKATDSVNSDPFSDTSGETIKNWHLGLVSDGSYNSNSRFSVINKGNERLVIDTNGNVGIGSVSPVYKLDVAGTAQFTQPVIVGTPTATNHAATKSYVDSTAASAAGSTWTVNGSNIYNSNSGNVGIGTTNPTAKLDVNYQGVFNTVTPGTAMYGLHFNGQTTADYANGITWNGGSSGAQAGLYVQGSGAYGTKMYFATTNAYVTGAQTRMMINNIGNIGIGTTNPLFKLDVAGTGSFTQPVIVGTPTATNHAATKSYVDSIASSAAGGGVGTGTTGQTLRHNGTSWISDSNLYNNGTNVGVGDSSPDTKLDVAGSIQAGTEVANTANIRLDIANAGSPQFSISDTNGDNYWAFGADDADNSFKILGSTSAMPTINNLVSPFLSITTSGNIGIGSNAPVFKLDVAGTGSFTQPVIVGTPTAAGHAATKSYVDSTASSAAGGGVGTGTTGQTLRNDGTNWVANSLLFNNGSSVGIGTILPGSGNLLNIKGLTPIIATGYGNSVGNMGQLVLEASDSYTTQKGGRIAFSGNAGTNGGAFTGQTRQDSVFGAIEGFKANNIANNAGGGLIFKTNYNPDGQMYERMRIMDTGNVGIGTNNPIASLDVFGKLKLTSGGTIYNTDSARWLDMTGTLTDSLKVSGDLYSTAGELKMAGTGISYLMGNVGIGTTNPGAKLNIYGADDGSSTGVLILATAGGTSLRLGGNTTYSWIQSHASKPLYINELGNNVIINPTSGNVGIGTTAPTEAKLVINAGTGMALKAYGNGIFTGTLQTQTGSDFAEEFITTKDLEPGTVVVMDDNGHKSVKPCAKSYDKTVVGIVSNNPSIIAGQVESKHKAIIAMMGVVKVKVSSVNGNISKGDLLTTSGISGYAMKAIDTKPGTIIGKALENLNTTTGQINVLVNLQ